MSVFPLNGRRSCVSLLLALASTSTSVFAEDDPIVMFDGFDGCAPVHRTIGPEGGVLRLCGAQLTIPAGSVGAPTTFGIERLESAPSAPFDMEPAGPAFRFTHPTHSCSARRRACACRARMVVAVAWRWTYRRKAASC